MAAGFADECGSFVTRERWQSARDHKSLSGKRGRIFSGTAHLWSRCALRRDAEFTQALQGHLSAIAGNPITNGSGCNRTYQGPGLPILCGWLSKAGFNQASPNRVTESFGFRLPFFATVLFNVAEIFFVLSDFVFLEHSPQVAELSGIFQQI